MEIKEFIENWIKIMSAKYASLRWKYTYSEKKQTHYIEVGPSRHVCANESYCNDENIFSLELDSKYPDEIVLFFDDIDIINHE